MEEDKPEGAGKAMLCVTCCVLRVAGLQTRNTHHATLVSTTVLLICGLEGFDFYLTGEDE